MHGDLGHGIFLFDDTRPRAHIEPCFGNDTVEFHTVHWWNTHMIDRCAVNTCVLLAVLSAACLLHAQAAPTDAAPGEGMWKAAVPPKPMKGEFDSLDPLGVAAGARIKADCSLNWIDPDDGKLYCFSSGTSLEFFLDKPQANLERARTSWRTMNPT
jgi:hypothetical protein